jgi:dTDP-L-rhamnose 4-epimerase
MGRRSAAPLIPTQPKAVFSWASFETAYGVCRIFCTRALQHLPLVTYEDRHQTRDFVHVDDVVEANMLVLEKDEANGQAFNVGGGCATSILEYARRVLERIPNSAGLDVSGEYRRGDTRHSVSCIEKLGRLGWRPKHGLDDILTDYLEWIDSSGGIPSRTTDAVADMRRAEVLQSPAG